MPSGIWTRSSAWPVGALLLFSLFCTLTHRYQRPNHSQTLCVLTFSQTPVVTECGYAVLAIILSRNLDSYGARCWLCHSNDHPTTMVERYLFRALFCLLHHLRQ